MRKAVKRFDKNKSSLRDIYTKYNVNDPGELQELFTKHDQTLMNTQSWDYHNTELLVNTIKKDIEGVGISTITDNKEQRWIREILWLWYHHAISCALYRYADKNTARVYAKKAVEIQPLSHANKITKLLYLLVHDKYSEAKAYINESSISDVEMETTRYLIKSYEDGSFFDSKIDKNDD
jgi:hypothetical protein